MASHITHTVVPATMEPNGLFRADGKRPDGLTLVSWREGRSVTLDVTVADTVAESYLSISSITAGAAAQAAVERKNVNHAELGGHHIFIPIAIETLGLFCVAGQSFIREIGRDTAAISSDLHEAAFLFQRLSLAVQRFNAICIAGTFPNVKPEASHM
jgi:hypothetical protein